MEKFPKVLFCIILALIRCIVGVGLCINIGVLIAHFICNIQPQETYSWISGIWHGVFFVPNLVRGFFSPEILYKASDFTTMYNVFWWIAVILFQGPIIVLIIIAPVFSIYMGLTENLIDNKMKMKVHYFFYIVLLCSMCSCGIIDMIEAERPVSYNSNNVYKDLKMDLFKGFVNKISVEDLVKDHGRPDTILDADEVAASEGYDIYRYRFPDGTIDCYVPKMAAQKLTGAVSNDSLNMTALVDYIYYEPNKNIPLKDFILNDSIRSLIPTGKSVVYYFGDPFYDIVRIRLAKNNKDEILNVALNDASMLDRENDISEFTNEVNGNEPVNLGDLGTIMKTEYTKRMLSFSVVANHSDINLKEFDSQNPSWANIVVIRLFEEQCGIFRWMTDDVIREGAGVKITLVDEKTMESISKTVDYSSFKDIFRKGISNIDRLKSFNEFENLTYPYTIQKMTCEKLRIEDNYQILPFSFSEAMPEDFEVDMSKLKKFEVKKLLDPENPERDNFSLCHKCNYGVKKVYTFVDREVVIEFTPEEVKKIMKVL